MKAEEIIKILSENPEAEIWIPLHDSYSGAFVKANELELRDVVEYEHLGFHTIKEDLDLNVMRSKNLKPIRKALVFSHN